MRRLPVSVKVKMMALSLNPTGSSGRASSSLLMSAAVRPRGGGVDGLIPVAGLAALHQILRGHDYVPRISGSRLVTLWCAGKSRKYCWELRKLRALL